MKKVIRNVWFGRLSVLTLLLAAPHFPVRPKPPILHTAVEQVAPATPRSVTSDAWPNLMQVQTERLSFPGYRVRETDTYDWLPDGRALLVRYASGTDHHNLFTASATRVEALSQFNRKCSHKLYADRSTTTSDAMQEKPATINAPHCWIAPDGKHFLWLVDDGVHTNLDGMNRVPNHWAVATLDGTSQQEWRPERFFHQGDDICFNDQACWLHDSRHWMTPIVADEKWTGCAVVDSNRSNQWRFVRFRSALDAVYATMLGELSNGFVLVCEWMSEDIDSPTLVRFRSGVSVALPEKLTVRLPLHGWVQEVQLAPKSNKLAWLLKSENKMALWISTTDGKSSGPPMAVPATLDISSLRWQPDGRHITFLNSGDLYRLTLPQSLAFTQATEK